MKVLALDIATTTGWAHTDGASGSQAFKPRPGDSPGMRLIEFRAWLNRLLEAASTNLIVYEQSFGLKGAANHILHSMIGVAEAVAAERGIEITSRASSSIKAHALGDKKVQGKKVKRSKARMVQAAENKWPDIDIVDDNHADALHLLSLVQMELGLPRS